jgi:DNA-binding CsgD family transcriptional regulator
MSPVSAEVLEQRDRNPYGLSDEEVIVVMMLSNGYDFDQIASRLGVQRPAIYDRLRIIMRRMECSSKYEIAPRWVREQENEELRKHLTDVLIALDAVDSLSKLRQHVFVKRARLFLGQREAA